MKTFGKFISWVFGILIFLFILYILDAVQITGRDLIFIFSFNITMTSMLSKLLSFNGIIILIALGLIGYVIFLFKGD